MVLLSLTLLLAAAPMAAPAPRELRVHEGLPTGFQVDGALEEWRGAPSLVLGAAEQVGGSARVKSAADLTAALWLAVGPEGLAVAGEVRDERVRLARGPRDVAEDGVEVWLGLPAPELPPLAFANQYGETAVPTPESCDGMGPTDAVRCRQWWKQMVEWRERLVGGFLARYPLGARARFTPMPGGYRFEALIPAAEFPRTAEAPLRHLALRVDVVDVDSGGRKLETVLSSAFREVTLAQPLRFGAWPELLEKVLAAQPEASYQPGPEASRVSVWFNAARWDQLTPDSLSPSVADVSLQHEEPVARLGDVEVVAVTVGVDGWGEPVRWLVSRHEGRLVDTVRLGMDSVQAIARPPGLHLLRVYTGSARALGSEACGDCGLVGLSLLKMDARGRFSESVELASHESPKELVWHASPDLTRIEIHEREGGTRWLAARFTYNPGTGGYVAAFPGRLLASDAAGP